MVRTSANSKSQMKVLTVTTMNYLLHIAFTARIFLMTGKNKRKVESKIRRKGMFLK